MSPNTIYEDPGQDRIIDELYAWICIDPETGLEGICGVALSDGLKMQAITSRRETIERLRPNLEELARVSGKHFKLVRFTTMETMEEIRG